MTKQYKTTNPGLLSNKDLAAIVAGSNKLFVGGLASRTDLKKK